MSHDAGWYDAGWTERNGDEVNAVDGLFAIADAIRYAADRLGTNNASTPMGALEALGQSVQIAASTLATAIVEAAERNQP